MTSPGGTETEARIVRASRAPRACRRVVFRLETAERAVREALAILPGFALPADVERYTRTLAELADLLADTARAFTPTRFALRSVGGCDAP